MHLFSIKICMFLFSVIIHDAVYSNMLIVSSYTRRLQIVRWVVALGCTGILVGQHG